MPTQVDEFVLTRRALVAAAGAGLVHLAMRTQSAASEAPEFSFYAGRSGRFNRGQVLVAGILSTSEEAGILESRLRGVARSRPGPPALHFSTSSKNEAYFSQVAQILSRSEGAIFSATEILTPDWPSDPLFWKSRRRIAEQKILENVSKESNLTIHALRHDYHQDQEIYSNIAKKVKGQLKFKFYDKLHEAPLLLQISGFLAKALNQPHRLQSVNETSRGAKNKSNIVRIAYNVFGVDSLKENSKTSIQLVHSELTI